MHKQGYLAIFTMITFSVACTQVPQKVSDIELSDLDTTVCPASDFDAYANGGWEKNNPLPGEKSRYGTFDKLDDQAREQVKFLFSEIGNGQYAEGSIEKKISDFYSSGMDSATVEAAGIAPVKEYLDQADSISNISDLQKVIAGWHRMGINPLFFMYADADQKNSSIVVAYLNQGGLRMPNRDYYLNEDDRSKGIQKKYIELITGTFRLLGDSIEVQQKAETIYSIEKEMATYSMSLLDQRDPYKTYHKMTIPQLTEIAPDYDWTGYFKETGVNDPEEFIVSQPDFFCRNQ